MAGLMYERPAQPITFIQQCLEQLDASVVPQEYPWDAFVGAKRRHDPPSRVLTGKSSKRLNAGKTPGSKESLRPLSPPKHATPSHGAGTAVSALPPIGKKDSTLNDINSVLASIKENLSRHSSNLMAKNFDEAYFRSLSHEDQIDLLRCCNSGIENADSGMGCCKCFSIRKNFHPEVLMMTTATIGMRVSPKMMLSKF